MSPYRKAWSILLLLLAVVAAAGMFGYSTSRAAGNAEPLWDGMSWATGFAVIGLIPLLCTLGTELVLDLAAHVKGGTE